MYNIDVFRGGAMVAQTPVKRKVVGSNPTPGAKKLDDLLPSDSQIIFLLTLLLIFLFGLFLFLPRQFLNFS